VSLSNNPDIKLSVCSLSRSEQTANSLRAQVGTVFPTDSEFLILDNSAGEWDCYGAIRHFLREARGDLIVLIHDDVEFGGLSASLLLERIREVSSKDPVASLFGVAGISFKEHRGIGHFYDANSEQNWGFHDDGKASSLDECFLVIKNGQGINVSKELKGYHFYGTDLCLNTMTLGLSCYVIDYPVIHKSAGSMNESFFAARDEFEEHLQRQSLNRLVRTTCTVFYGAKNERKRCWALAMSYVLIESPRHRDFELAARSILKRGYDRYGKPLFSLMIYLARLTKWASRSISDAVWWRQNWRVRLLGGKLT